MKNVTTLHISDFTFTCLLPKTCRSLPTWVCWTINYV